MLEKNIEATVVISRSSKVVKNVSATLSQPYRIAVGTVKESVLEEFVHIEGTLPAPKAAPVQAETHNCRLAITAEATYSKGEKLCHK